MLWDYYMYVCTHHIGEIEFGKYVIGQFVLIDYYMYVCTHHIGEIEFKKFYVLNARINSNWLRRIL